MGSQISGAKCSDDEFISEKSHTFVGKGYVRQILHRPTAVFRVVLASGKEGRSRTSFQILPITITISMGGTGGGGCCLLVLTSYDDFLAEEAHPVVGHLQRHLLRPGVRRLRLRLVLVRPDHGQDEHGEEAGPGPGLSRDRLAGAEGEHDQAGHGDEEEEEGEDDDQSNVPRLQ